METHSLNLPVPNPAHFGSDEQVDADFARWCASYEHAFIHVYEDPEYF
jgi:hypothetical protein